jgi:chemotaxis protein methyltransferase CheR
MAESGSGAIHIDPRTFAAFCALVYERSGITLRAGKESLVTARVARRMHQLGQTRVADYIAHVRADASGEEMVLLLDAIATNTTSFFREPAAFTMLAEVVGGLLERGQRRIRVWSAASSTGEEPFTIAMVLAEVMRGRGLDEQSVDLAVLATDLSTKVLDRCRQALYSESVLRPVPADLRARYFVRQGEAWRVCDRLRALVTFNRLNLARPPYPMRGGFAVVFCRNVMIYFDQAVRTRVMAEVGRQLVPGGWLAIGNAESLNGIDHPFGQVRPSIYRKGEA